MDQLEVEVMWGVNERVAVFVACIVWSSFVFVPLGLWKLIEIIWWLYNNVEVGLK